MRWLAMLGIGFLALSGCGDEPRSIHTPAPPVYVANDSPDNVMANLALALGTMDSLGYAALLYDGALLATDGLAYAPYKFYFDRSLDPTLPEVDLYERELERLGAMLGGTPGMDENGDVVPGLRSFALDLAATSSWAAPIGPDVDGDAYPVGTLRQVYDTSIVITLESTYGMDTNGWAISDRLLAHCIPVQVDGEIEWRLWKWREIIVGYKRAVRPGVESTSLGRIKVLYGD